jgi:hypothetical protein
MHCHNKEDVSMLLRFIVLLVTIIALTPISTVSAQGAATWQRTYPERTQPACTWIVAQWSDGTYSASAWECDAGQAAVRSDGARATRGYPQIADNGCTEYVSQWSDQSYSWVPWQCPAGVVYPKSKSRGVQPVPRRQNLRFHGLFQFGRELGVVEKRF